MNDFESIDWLCYDDATWISWIVMVQHTWLNERCFPVPKVILVCMLQHPYSWMMFESPLQLAYTWCTDANPEEVLAVFSDWQFRYSQIQVICTFAFFVLMAFYD